MGNRYLSGGGNASETGSTRAEYGSNTSHRSYPHSSTSSDARARAEYGSNTSHRSYPHSSTSFDTRCFNYNYNNHNSAQNPNVQCQTRNDPSPGTFQYPQSYSVPAPDPRQRLPLTQQTLYANHTQCVDPITRQQREQQQYASQAAAAQSLGIDMTNPAFAPVARERPQASRPMDAYAAEPGPRYLSVAPPQDHRRQGRRGNRL